MERVTQLKIKFKNLKTIKNKIQKKTDVLNFNCRSITIFLFLF